MCYVCVMNAVGALYVLGALCSDLCAYIYICSVLSVLRAVLCVRCSALCIMCSMLCALCCAMCFVLSVE